MSYRPVHRLTPLLKFWTLILALFAACAVNVNASLLGTIGSFIRGDATLVPMFIGLGIVALMCAAIWLLSHAWWKATGYRLTDEEVSVRHGVLSRQERSARYDRIQAVDVVEPVIARLFRVAAVRIETAGGSTSVIEIAYLPKDTAGALRTEVLACTREPVADTNPVEDTRILVPEIPIARSLVAALGNPLVLPFAISMGLLVLASASWGAALPFVVGLVGSLWKVIDQSWRYTARLTEDGLALDVTYGLADRRRQTIPLRRIHGISIQQRSWWWRFPGWWMVKVSVAGYGTGSNPASGTTTLLPVGERDTALRMAALLGPLTEAEIDVHARPEGAHTPDYTSPTQARWVSPIDWKQQATTLLPGVVVCHSGRFVRRVAFLAAPHIQELTLRRGPIHQALNLGTVRLNLVNGPVQMSGLDLSARDAEELLKVLRGRQLPAYTPTHENPLDEPRPPAD